MAEKSIVLIIIPAYNEEKNIPGVIKGIQSCLDKPDIVVINDGSTDCTSNVAKRAGARVINLPFNVGYGSALQTGYKYALENDYDYIVQLDGDGQHAPIYIKALLKKIQNDIVDIVIGSRFLANNDYKVLFARRLGMALFRRIVADLIGQTVTDPISGFKAMNRKTFGLLATDIYPDDYPDADVIIMLHRLGFCIEEIPVTMQQNPAGHKSMHKGFMKPIYYIYKMLLSIFVTLMRKK